MRTYRLLILLFVIVSQTVVIHTKASDPLSDPYLSASTMMYLSSETPDTPGPISGANRPCPGVVQTYSTAKISGASVKDYIWDVPGGMTIVSDNNTSIVVNVNKNCYGYMSVWAVGYDNSLSPVRRKYIYNVSLNASIQSDSYMEGSTVMINGETHYELANDKVPLEFKVNVDVNRSFVWSIYPSVSWMTEPPVNHSADETGIPIYYTKNLTGSQRTGRLKFGCNSSYPMDNIYIVQKPPYVNTFPDPDSYLYTSTIMDATEYHLSRDGGTFKIDVGSNSAWQVSSKPSWMTIVSGSSGGSDGGQVQLSYETSPVNPGTHLNGKVIFSCGSQLVPEVQVEQEPYIFTPYPLSSGYIRKITEGSNTIYEVSDQGGTFQISLASSNLSGYINNSSNWLHGTASFSESTVTVSIEYDEMSQDLGYRYAAISLISDDEFPEITKVFVLKQVTLLPERKCVGPKDEYNYIYTMTPRIKVDETTIEQVRTSNIVAESYTINDFNDVIVFYDGLGRPEQELFPWAAPDFQDIVKPHVYDDYGREAIDYLPFNTLTSSHEHFVSNAVSKQQDFYTGIFGSEDGSEAFTETVYDFSPLNRVTEVAASGAAWQIIDDGYLMHQTLHDVNEQSIYEGHTAKTMYSTNANVRDIL